MVKNVDLLKLIPVLSQLNEEDLEKVADLLKEMKVSKDTTVVRQGDVGDTLFIVQSGQVRSSVRDAVGREKALGLYGVGQFFGEMALLNGQPWSESMQAVQDSRLLTLSKADFDAFLAQNISVMLQVMKLIADRQAAATPRPPRVEDAGPATPGGGKVFTVFSPKGGVGKSMLAVNLAVALAQQRRDSVALLDLSLTFGHDLLLLNLTVTSSLAATTADALRKSAPTEGISYYLTTHESSTLRVLAGSMRPEEGEALTGEAAKVAIDQLKRHFAYVVVDTSSTFGDPVLSALESSDRVLILCSPEIAVLRDLRECQRIFNDVVRLQRDKVLYLLNNVYSYKGLSREQIEEALQQPLYFELPHGGDVPLKSSLRGEAFVEKQSGSSIAKAVQKLASQLVAETSPRGAAVGDKKWGLFGR